jgi:soluble lytic murein transglycosylase-like protein
MYFGAVPQYDERWTRAAVEDAYADPFGDYIRAAAGRYGVPESWIRAVIQVESAWKPAAYRYEAKIEDASYGLMQLLYSTAAGLGYTGPAAGLYDPETNIDLGTRLLAQLRDRYGEDFARIYSAYNSGRPDLYLTSTEVYNHVQKALTALNQYAGQAAQTLTTAAGAAVSTAQEFPGLVLLGGLALLFFGSGRR